MGQEQNGFFEWQGRNNFDPALVSLLFRGLRDRSRDICQEKLMEHYFRISNFFPYKHLKIQKINKLEQIYHVAVR